MARRRLGDFTGRIPKTQRDLLTGSGCRATIEYILLRPSHRVISEHAVQELSDFGLRRYTGSNSPVIDCREDQSQQRNQARRSCLNLALASQQGNPEEQERGEEVELQHAPGK